MSQATQFFLSPAEFEVLLLFESGEHYSFNQIKDKFTNLHTQEVTNTLYKHLFLKINEGEVVKILNALVKKGFIKTIRHNHQVHLWLSWIGEQVMNPGK